MSEKNLSCPSKIPTTGQSMIPPKIPREAMSPKDPQRTNESCWADLQSTGDPEAAAPETDHPMPAQMTTSPQGREGTPLTRSHTRAPP